MTNVYRQLINPHYYDVLAALRATSHFSLPEIARRVWRSEASVEATLNELYGEGVHLPETRGDAVRECEPQLVTRLQNGEFALTQRGRMLMNRLARLADLAA